MEQKRVPLTIKRLSEREFEGYGSTFGNPDLGGDVILPGAFTDSLKEYEQEGSLPLMFWAHDSAQVPGVWKEMSEDRRGLYVKGELADTQLGNEVRTLLGMKAVRGLSIGFSIESHEDIEYDDTTRLIKRARLWEVSVVSLPMNPRAQVTHAKARLSSSGEYVPTAREMAIIKRDLERWLRLKGFPKPLAVAYASAAFAGDPATEESAQSIVTNGVITTDTVTMKADGATPDGQTSSDNVATTESEARDASMPQVTPEFRRVQQEVIDRLNGVNESMLASLIAQRLARPTG